MGASASLHRITIAKATSARRDADPGEGCRLAAPAAPAGGSAFGVGGLARLLRNRFYIGEVVCRGEKPIISPQKSGLFAVGTSE